MPNIQAEGRTPFTKPHPVDRRILEEIREFVESFDPTVTTQEIDNVVADWLDDLHERHRGYDMAGLKVPVDTIAISARVQETNRAKAFIFRLVYLWFARSGQVAVPEHIPPPLTKNPSKR